MIKDLSRRRKIVATAKLLIVPLAVIALLAYLYAKSNDGKANLPVATPKTTHSICIDSKIPSRTKESFATGLKQLNTDQTEYEIRELGAGDTAENCSLTVHYNLAETDLYEKLWTKLYVPVTTIASPQQEIETTKLRELFFSRYYNQNTIKWDNETDAFLSSKYDLGGGYTLPTFDDLQSEISANKNLIAIMPFEKFGQSMKILRFNEMSPLENDFNISAYPLTETYWLSKESSDVKTTVKPALLTVLGQENYVSGKITSVITTGSSDWE